MFKRIRTIDSKKYVYLEKSFRTGKKIRKLSFYLGLSGLNDFSEMNKEQINLLTEEMVTHLYHNLKIDRCFVKEMIYKIENYKIQFNILWDLLDAESKKELLDEYITRFLVNSMVMEGSTITYGSAERINQLLLKKRVKAPQIKIVNLTDEDVRLYAQLKKALERLNKFPLRYAKNISDLHKIIYQDIYSFAGKFRKKDITFGDPYKELAKTIHWTKIRELYNAAIKNFRTIKNKEYIFQKIINFHIDYQEVHGFEDGNSRLGRLIMMRQMLSEGYPPVILRGTKSISYRRSLVKAINNKQKRAFAKLMYEDYKRTFEKFWFPRMEKKLRNKKISPLGK